MKRINFILLICVTLLSCSKEESDNPKSDNFLVGKWIAIEEFDSGEVWPYEDESDYAIFTDTQVKFFEDDSETWTWEYKYNSETKEVIMGGNVTYIEVVNKDRIKLGGDSSVSYGTTYIRYK